MGTDRDWERWGKDEPYYGVLSTDGFRSSHLDPESRKAFFDSGEAHVQRLVATLATLPGGLPPMEKILDFGCGVGRLLVPFSRHCRQATGMDISASMRREAMANAHAAGRQNVEVIASDDGLSGLKGQYDLVHSYLVLQHIPARRSVAIVRNLLDRVASGGCASIQFLCACNSPWPIRLMVRARYVLPPLQWTRNLLLGRHWSEPAMQMHLLDLAKVLGMAHEAGFTSVLVEPSPVHEGQFLSVFIHARRK